MGRLKQDRWTDTDGKPHSRVLIVAEHVEFKPQFKKQDPDGDKEGDEEGTEQKEETEQTEEALAEVS